MRLGPNGLLAGCVTLVVATASAKQTSNPTVALSPIQGTYPAIAQSARVSGRKRACGGAPGWHRFRNYAPARRAALERRHRVRRRRDVAAGVPTLMVI